MKKNEIINFYDEPEMPKTIEELRKENADSLKEINIQNSVIDGVFTLEEYKEIKKLLDELKKHKQEIQKATILFSENCPNEHYESLVISSSSLSSIDFLVLLSVKSFALLKKSSKETAFIDKSLS